MFDIFNNFDDTRGLNDNGLHGWDVTVTHGDILKVLLSLLNRLKLLIEDLRHAGAATM